MKSLLCKKNTLNEKKGFSLLEMVIVIGLFAVLLEVTLGVLTHVYKAYINYQQAVYYEHEVKSITHYIRESIRRSDCLCISVSDGEAKEIQAEAEYACEEVKGRLKTIEVCSDKGKEGVLRLRAHTSYDASIGRYSLEYVEQGTLTWSLVSNLIEDIEVRRLANSNEVLFTCTVGKIDGSRKVQASFIESIDYKKQID